MTVLHQSIKIWLRELDNIWLTPILFLKNMVAIIFFSTFFAVVQAIGSEVSEAQASPKARHRYAEKFNLVMRGHHHHHREQSYKAKKAVRGRE